MAWYRSGSVTITANSVAVTGSGTLWLSVASAGDMFVGPDTNVYEILSVNSDSSLTLARNYTGTAVSNSSDYSIRPTHDCVKVRAKTLKDLKTTLASISSTGTTTSTDPTQAFDNIATIFNRTDNVVASISTTVQVFDSLTYHFNTKKNAAGEILSISAWGAGSSGLVAGY